MFTSQYVEGQRGPGDWGGIIIAGRATVNTPSGEFLIEGGTGAIGGGGLTPNDDDSSGVMRYVRLEFSGIAFQPDNEINGLTMTGVGRKTVIEYIQVSFCGDDSFEWFGGAADHKYLISFKPVDDDFDTDLGYSGRLQFGFSLREPNIADISSSNGFESDNNSTGSFTARRTSPLFSNFTMVGPFPDTGATANSLHQRGAHLRRATLTSIYNSIFMGYRVGALLDGSAVVGAAQNDTLQIRNSIWAARVPPNGIQTNQGGFDSEAWFLTESYGNRRYVQPSEVMLTDPFNLIAPNPVPQEGSPALTGADFTNSRLQDGFFTPTTYVGAF
ncbi:MAG: T9SS C-terminal target domain-containing protein, partial [Bacteroidota bacterium]